MKNIILLARSIPKPLYIPTTLTGHGGKKSRQPLEPGPPAMFGFPCHWTGVCGTLKIPQTLPVPRRVYGTSGSRSSFIGAEIVT